MRRQIWRRHVAPLGRDVAVSGWGHYGRPVVILPDAGGDALQIERYRLVEALAPLIDAGRVKIYSLDALPEPVAHAAFVAEELLPLVWRDCGRTPQRFLAAGISRGAARALEIGLVHPEWIDVTITLSAAEPDRAPEHVSSMRAASLAPALAELTPERVQLLRERLFLIATGCGPLEAPWESERLAVELDRRGLTCQLETWGKDANHDWPTWGRMLRALLDRLA